jgi:fructokinase
VSQKIEQLAERFDLQLVAFTRGERGSLLYQRGVWSDRPGQKLDVVDTIGAGDAFTAALVMGLLNQFSLEDIHQIAADIATFVCSQPGATPVLPADLRAAFVQNLTSF